jgi:hypothetical protein
MVVLRIKLDGAEKLEYPRLATMPYVLLQRFGHRSFPGAVTADLPGFLDQSILDRNALTAYPLFPRGV